MDPELAEELIIVQNLCQKRTQKATAIFPQEIKADALATLHNVTLVLEAVMLESVYGGRVPLVYTRPENLVALFSSTLCSKLVTQDWTAFSAHAFGVLRSMFPTNPRMRMPWQDGGEDIAAVALQAASVVPAAAAIRDALIATWCLMEKIIMHDVDSPFRELSLLELTAYLSWPTVPASRAMLAILLDSVRSADGETHGAANKAATIVLRAVKDKLETSRISKALQNGMLPSVGSWVMPASHAVDHMRAVFRWKPTLTFKQVRDVLRHHKVYLPNPGGNVNVLEIAHLTMESGPIPQLALPTTTTSMTKEFKVHTAMSIRACLHKAFILAHSSWAEGEHTGVPVAAIRTFLKEFNTDTMLRFSDMLSRALAVIVAPFGCFSAVETAWSTCVSTAVNLVAETVYNGTSLDGTTLAHDLARSLVTLDKTHISFVPFVTTYMSNIQHWMQENTGEDAEAASGGAGDVMHASAATATTSPQLRERAKRRTALSGATFLKPCYTMYLSYIARNKKCDVAVMLSGAPVNEDVEPPEDLPVTDWEWHVGFGCGVSPRHLASRLYSQNDMVDVVVASLLWHVSRWMTTQVIIPKISQAAPSRPAAGKNAPSIVSRQKGVKRGRSAASSAAVTLASSLASRFCDACGESCHANCGCDHSLCLQCACRLLHARAAETTIGSGEEGGTFAPGKREWSCPFPGCTEGTLAWAAPFVGPDTRHALWRAQAASKADELACSTLDPMVTSAQCAWCWDAVQANKKDGVVAVCKTCALLTCTKCKGPAHPGEPCTGTQLSAQSILSDAKAQCCPHCSVPTTKDRGCNHITCDKCNGHWCWACSAPISGTDHYSLSPSCLLLTYSIATETQRMRSVVLSRQDISDAQKEEALYLLATTSAQLVSDI